MSISAVCPRCRETYHVQESLRGKPMRCLKSGCRNVFIIDDAPPPDVKSSGSVGEIIPLLPVEDEPPIRATAHVADVLELLPAEAEESHELPLEQTEAEEPPAVAADWSSPPPVRRTAVTPAESEDPPRPPRKPDPPREPAPRVVEAGDWSEPPVRRREEPPKDESDPSKRSRKSNRPMDEASPESDYDLQVQPRTRWVKWVILPLVLLTVVGLAGGVYLVFVAIRDSEQRLAREAYELFDNEQFNNASQIYGKLVEKHADSEYADYYRYRQELSDLRQRVADGDNDLGETLDHAEQFVRERAKDPTFADDLPGLAQSVLRRLSTYAKDSLTDLKDEQPLAMQDRARPLLVAMRKIKLPKDVSAPDWNQSDEAFTELRQAVDRLRAKQAVVARLNELAKSNTGYPAIVAVENYLQEIKSTFPEVASSDESRQLLERLYDNHLAGVRYQPVSTEKDGPIRAGGGQLPDPSILFDPSLRSAPTDEEGVTEEVPALSLVRGVLYAMNRATGRVLWARRVGIDTTTLPVVVPRRIALKDLLLVLSSDTNSLTALNVQGGVEWSYALPSPVLGRPVVADRRAYLATYAGEVHEIELSEGRLLGKYTLGQRLTLGGTAEPGSSRVYFPADDNCIYVLDVASKRCEQILYSRHPAGSLRGELILLPPIGNETPGYLVLNQAVGLDRVRLRVFDLPIRDRVAAERPLSPPATLDGWTWFAPYHDSEKLILLSDASRLGLFGIRQPFNRDQALFSLLPGGSYDLSSRLGATRRGRAEVVKVEGGEVWVLASSRMQRLRLVWDLQQGPRLVDSWAKPIEVGSPLHASQSFNSRLVCVTRPANRSCAWVSCIDDENGNLIWRRQLGMVARQTPIPIPVGGEAQGGEDQGGEGRNVPKSNQGGEGRNVPKSNQGGEGRNVPKSNQGGEGRNVPTLKLKVPNTLNQVWLSLDQSGALFSLDPTKDLLKKEPPTLLAEGLAENLDQPPMLLQSQDGKMAYALSFPGDGREMVVRQVSASNLGDRGLNVRESRVNLPDVLSGKPSIVGDWLILPLANGVLSRVPLPLPETPVPEDGPNWRSERVGANSSCFIVPLNGSRFVTSDGGRGLMVWDWPAGAGYEGLPTGRGDEPTLGVKERIVHAVALPNSSVGGLRPLAIPGQPSLIVADSSGDVSLVEVDGRGGLVLRRTWSLRGEITAAPFLRGTGAALRIGCILDRSKLVWINPRVLDVEWTFATPNEAPIVGDPQFCEGLLVVADQAGRYVGLDPATGKPVGRGYSLHGSIAPVASPVSFQPGRLLAPLSDGTALLLDVQRLKR